MVKERLEILEDYQTHSMVVNAYIDDVDVLVFSRMNLRLMSITLKLTMVPLYNPLPPKLKILEESDEEIMEEALVEIRQNSVQFQGDLPTLPSFSRNPGQKLLYRRLGIKSEL